ncbi:unnamed protein product [Trichobilharzia szidati]|nr:unnamed protein product [Trichobilharzia szidati]
MQDCGSVFVVPDGVINCPSKCYLVKLNHPRSDIPCLFLWNSQSSQLFEIQSTTQKFRSWLVGGDIKTDGVMYLCSRIDPLFFCISFCKKQTKFVSWHSLLSEAGDNCSILSSISNLEGRLEEICEKKCVGSLSVYRYDESRTLEWLSNRVSDVCQAALQSANPVLNSQLRLIISSSSSDGSKGGSEDSRVPEFTSSSEEAQLLSVSQLPQQLCLELAYQLVADYLTPDISKKLREKIGLKTSEDTPSDINTSTTVDSENVDPAVELHQKSENSKNCQPKEDYSSVLKLKESKTNEPVPKKAKIPKGVQSITSFFTKK